MSSNTTLLLFLLFFLNIQPSSPSSLGFDLVTVLRRKLLAVTSTFTTLTPDNTHLKLCGTDVCDSRRPDGPSAFGQCDRWARADDCPEQQIFKVHGDPGTNDKAEMFFNLRSPWNVSCEKGSCTPALGSVYDVFVAEGCIPERDYISEMQDTSLRVSKQVKIYLRRKAEFYITVQRRAGITGGPFSNCSFGMTVGAIEALSDTANCFGVRRFLRTEAAAGNVPNCRDVMPQYNQFQQPDTSAQATFVVALIGLGILVLALLVLGGVLLRRWSRRKAQKAKDLEEEFGGVPPGVVSELSESARPEASAAVVMDVSPPAPREEEQPRKKRFGQRTAEDRKRLQRRLQQIEAGVEDEDLEEGELGAMAGVLEGRGSSASLALKNGRGGSKLVVGSGSAARVSTISRRGDEARGSGSASGSSGSAGSAGRTSPADELYRSRLTARLVPGSPGGSRVPTPPEGQAGPRGPAPRRAPGSRGSSIAGDDIELAIKRRPDSASTSGSAAEWVDSTGIRIDDILSVAKGAAAQAGTPDRSRAWKAGDRQSPALSVGSGSSSSGERKAVVVAGNGAKSRPESEASDAGSRQPPVPRVPADHLHPQPLGRPTRPPVMAPLMAARLGIKPQQAIGGRAMAPLGSKTTPEKSEPSQGAAPSRLVMLKSMQQQQPQPQPQPRASATLPVAGQAGVPLPPPRPAGAVLPPSRVAGGAVPTPRAAGAGAAPFAAGAGAAPFVSTGNGTPRAAGASPRPFEPQALGQPAVAWRSPATTPVASAQRSPVTGVGGVNARPPLGAGAGLRTLGNNGTNGRDGRGMLRIGGGRNAADEHVLEEDG